jgi:hypothetical protein
MTAMPVVLPCGDTAAEMKSTAAKQAQARFSMASTSSLPTYTALPERPFTDYTDLAITPPQSIYELSQAETPKSHRKPAAAAPGWSPYASPERMLQTGLPTELDMLIAQTSSILLASSECLNSTVEAREKLKRFYLLDDMLDR